MKREAVGSSKMKKLCRSLGIKLYAAVGLMECLWHLTAREAPQGNIGKLSNEDIALSLGWEECPDKLVVALVECRWLDESDEHRLIVHDWHEHADDAVDMKLARSGRLYANGRQPNMRRMSKDVRANICAQFGWSTDAVHTVCAHMREGGHISALPAPEPVPAPAPAPEPVPEPDVDRSPILGLPVLRVPVPRLTGEMVSRSVLSDAGLSGQELDRNTAAVAESEIQKGRDGREVADEIADALNRYQAARREGRLTQYAPKPANFIGDGVWRDPKLWPWKDGHGPPKAKTTHDPLADLEAQRAKAKEERDRAGNSQ